MEDNNKENNMLKKKTGMRTAHITSYLLNWNPTPKSIQANSEPADRKTTLKKEIMKMKKKTTNSTGSSSSSVKKKDKKPTKDKPTPVKNTTKGKNIKKGLLKIENAEPSQNSLSRGKVKLMIDYFKKIPMGKIEEKRKN